MLARPTHAALQEEGGLNTAAIELNSSGFIIKEVHSHQSQHVHGHLGTETHLTSVETFLLILKMIKQF